jgi:pentatricopeptide repeat protein
MNIDMDIDMTCMMVIRSLVHTLEIHSSSSSTTTNNTTMTTSNNHAPPPSMNTFQIQTLQNHFNRAIIQAIRASADYGDYNMIFKIVHLAMQYATCIYNYTYTHDIHIHTHNHTHTHTHTSTPIIMDNTTSTTTSISLLQPRIFGEAITELKRTKVGTSKIKRLWKQFIYIYHHSTSTGTSNNTDDDDDDDVATTNTNTNTNTSFMTSRPSAYELNTMLITLANRGKVKAALSLYYNHVWNDSTATTTTSTTTATAHKNSNIDAVPTLQIDGDVYTTSTIMTILADSIASEECIHVSSSSSSSSSAMSPIEKQKQTSSKQKRNSNHSSSLPLSPCWQWREAEKILDKIKQFNQTDNMLNNHVYSAILKVSEEASELYKYPGNRHFGSTTAMSLLERMKHDYISPDVVTCSAVMAAFDKGKQWKAALALLKSMERSDEAVNDLTTKNTMTATTATLKMDNVEKKSWQLPLPNEYTYASAISSCARCGQFDDAIQILDRIRNDDDSKKIIIHPNTWMYNAALAACMPMPHPSKTQKEQNSKRSRVAKDILQRMEDDASSGSDTSPDTVTYNTMIATMGSDFVSIEDEYDNADDSMSSNILNHESLLVKNEGQTLVSEIEIQVLDLIQKMKENGVQRDPITYRNAILICKSDVNAAMRLIDVAFDDLVNFDKAVIFKWGSLSEIKAYLINSALSVTACRGDMDLVAVLFQFMVDGGIRADSRSMNHLIIALSSAGYCEESMWILNAMKGDGAANAMFQEKYRIDIIACGNFADKPLIEEYHYSTAITCCLRQGQLFPALKILNGMKVHSLKPNDSSLHGIIVAYCKLATEASSVEFKEAKIEQAKKNKRPSRNGILPVKYQTSRTRATAALAMLKSLKETPVRLKSIVASTCAAAGMWIEARNLLWSIHIEAVKERDQHRSALIVQNQGSAISELPKIHKSLLKLCARSGNVTAALWYSDAIQDLSVKFENRSRNMQPNPTTFFSQAQTKDIIKTIQKENDAILPSLDNSFAKSGIGMGAEEWKLVNIAASKSCHWKVCLGALQFLKPYVEATHPRNAGVKGLLSLNQDYESIARCLTDAILAFEARSQYAWAVRAIDDWIEWSGRRPRKEAVFATCRILAARGLGYQVTALVTKVLELAPLDNDAVESDKIPSYEESYERAIYTEAITSLYKHGFYDNADELYAAAASQKFLMWAIVETKNRSQLQLDLHGMNKGVAHSAVRVSLQHYIQSISRQDSIEYDVMIITGQGKRSSQHLRPVLRPEVQRMLMEEFFPPIGTSSIPGNMGALKVPSADVNAWFQQQQQQKGVRFLAVADVLKTLTSGERLKSLIQKKIDGNSGQSE